VATAKLSKFLSAIFACYLRPWGWESRVGPGAAAAGLKILRTGSASGIEADVKVFVRCIVVPVLDTKPIFQSLSRDRSRAGQ
jgi:hypothetical protein